MKSSLMEEAAVLGSGGIRHPGGGGRPAAGENWISSDSIDVVSKLATTGRRRVDHFR